MPSSSNLPSNAKTLEHFCCGGEAENSRIKWCCARKRQRARRGVGGCSVQMHIGGLGISSIFDESKVARTGFFVSVTLSSMSGILASMSGTMAVADSVSASKSFLSVSISFSSSDTAASCNAPPLMTRQALKP